MPKSNTLQISPCEFEGLLSFEEINSYKVLNEVKQSGKKTFKVEICKNGKKIKAKRKEDKSKPQKVSLKGKTHSENKSSSDNIAKVKKVKGLKRKRQQCAESESPQKKILLDVDVESWRAIFTPECVIDAIKELGFQEPTPIQKLTIPAAIKSRRDIIGAAETGSGKTLAFIIPIIHGILRKREKEAAMKDKKLSGQVDDDSKNDDEESEPESDLNSNEENSETEEKGIGCVKVLNNVPFDFQTSEHGNTRTYPNNKLRALIVTPTRELAVQIKEHADAVLSKTDIKSAVVIGGLSYEKQERVLRKGPEIVIGTPGRLWELLQQGNPHLAHLPEISFLVVDETDRMLEKGHFEELQQLLELINADYKFKNLRQTFVFSATLTLTHGPPNRLKTKKKVMKVTSEMKIENLTKLIGVRQKPKVVDITRKFGTAETLSEAKMFCDKDEKDWYLYYFLNRFPGRTLVFCNSINCVRRLTNLLTLLQIKPLALHASKQQKQRLKSLERFASNQNSVLLATDVAARGLDIRGVNHIFHYEVPRTAETYVHRSGRTARANQEGLSVLLVDSSELIKYRHLCTTLNRSTDLPSFPVDGGALDQVRQRVELAREIETMNYSDSKNNDTWFQNMAEEAGFDIINSDMDDDEVSEMALQKKKRTRDLQVKKSRLTNLLSLPMASASFSGKYPTSTGALLLPDYSMIIKGTTPNDAIEFLKERKNTKILPQIKKSKPKQQMKKRRNKRKT